MDPVLTPGVAHTIFFQDNLEQMISLLNNGGILLLPTDTTWGLSCDATNPEAIQRLRDIQHRPTDAPFVLLAPDLEMVGSYVEHIHPRMDLLLAYHTRPVSIIYETAKLLPPEAIAPDGSVAFRVVRDEFCLRLLRVFGKPLISSLPARFGLSAPEHYGQINSDIISQVDYVVRHRRHDLEPQVPSTIIRLGENEEFDFLRE